MHYTLRKICSKITAFVTVSLRTEMLQNARMFSKTAISSATPEKLGREKKLWVPKPHSSRTKTFSPGSGRSGGGGLL
jgi:hypothetical protein